MPFLPHQVICRFHKHILALAVLLTIAATILAADLDLNSNLFSLLPSDNDSVSAYFEIAEGIGLQSLLIALVETPQGCNQQRCDSFVDFLGKQLSRSPLIHDVEYKSEKQQLLLLVGKYMEYFPLFLHNRGLKELALKLSDKGIREQVQVNKKLLAAPFSIGAEVLVYADPLGLRDLLEHAVALPSGKYPFRPHNGFYRSQDGRTYFLFIRPKKPPQDINFSKELMTEVAGMGKTSLAEFSKKYGSNYQKIRISYAGGYPIAVNDESKSKKDIKVTILSSFLAVMLLFGLTFRTTRVIFFVGVPLALTLLWTLGFARLVFHNLSILSCVFSCVLIGLGIDFAIHIVNRYFDEGKSKLDVQHRLAHTFEEAGVGLVIGGGTTAAAFYSIAISDFKGFRELGILTGTGIVICLLAMLFVLPSLLVYFPEKKTSGTTPKIAGFGLRKLLTFLQRYPRSFIMLAFLSFCLVAAAGTKIRFDDNLRNFRPADQEVFRLQDKVTGWLGGSTSEILLVIQGQSETEVMETNAAVNDALNGLKTSGMIAGVKSIGSYFAAPSQQQSNREFIEQHRDVFNIKRIKTTFNDALQKNGFARLDVYDGYFETLAKAFQTKKLVVPSIFKGTKLDKFVNMFVFRTGKGFKAITYIVPSKDLWSRAGTRRLKEKIIAQLAEKGINRNEFKLTGANLLTGDLKGLIIKNLKLSMWVACLSIIAILTAYYRKLKLVTLATLPLIMGLGASIGIMAIFHIDFNFFNLIVLPMVIGIGIDDGVHLTNTFRQCRNGDILLSLSQTARAVVLTSLTTLAGFGSLALSHYPGLRSIGYVAIIGVGACLLASVVLLPPILAMLKPSNRSSA